MSKKNKIKIKKFILYFLLIGAVITFCATILSIILPVILGYDEAVIEKIFKRYIIPPYICVALPFVICFELWGNVLAHGAKALQYNTKFNNFERLKSYLKSNLLEHDYSMITSIIKDDTESIVYVRELKETFAHKLTSCRKQVEFYIIVKMSEITKEFRKNVDLELFKLMSKYYGKSVVTEGFYVNCDAELAMKHFEMYGSEVIRDEIYMNLIICVDKENEDFRKLMNSEIKQGMYTYFLSTGIVFSKNKIYITKSDMMHYSYYRKLKKSFVKMMNISKEDKVKK